MGFDETLIELGALMDGISTIDFVIAFRLS